MTLISYDWTRALALLCLSLALVLGLAAALTSSFAQAPSLQPPPEAQVINLTPHPGNFSEPSIAVNRENPLQLVAAYQVNASVAYSQDGGQTWTLATGTVPRDYRVSGDVSMTYDSRGHALLCYIAFDKLGTENYWAHNATRNGIFVRRSLDGGKTWEPEARTVIAQPTQPVMPFEDKPYIVADHTHGPYAGNLYVGWTEFTLTKTVILFSRSTDGGASWSTPIEISMHEGLPRDDNGSVEGFDGVVAPDGTLDVIWADGNEIVMASSSDGGRTFTPSRKILDVAAPYFKVENVYRSNGFPQIDIDPHSGRLFVTWADYRNGDVDVFCSTSMDQGRTWSSAVRVNSDPAHDGADQFFQWMAVDPTDGAAYVIFYDRRDDPANKLAKIVLARSTDGGANFINYAWTQEPFDAREDFIGDYTGVAAFGGRVYGVWTEERARPKPVAKPGPEDAQDIPARRMHTTIVLVSSADFGHAR
ncbi:MAG: hypothetical protein WBC04_22770 [Candidatus Acidiferrales bacterium]